MDLITIALALGAALFWALTWLLMKLGVDRMHWVGFGFLRPWLGFLFVLPTVLLTDGVGSHPLRLILIAMGGGIINIYLGNVFFFQALKRGSLHESTMLANTSPFWGVVTSILVLAEPARWFTFVAGGLVIGGATLLVGRPDRAANSSRHSTLARLAALGAGLMWGFSATVPTKHCLSGGMTAMQYQLFFLCGAAVSWSVAALPSFRRKRIRFTARGVLIALGSSFAGLFASWILWLTALQRVDASVLSPLWALAPLLTVVLSVVLLRERVARRALLGGGLILGGVLLVSLLAGA